MFYIKKMLPADLKGLYEAYCQVNEAVYGGEKKETEDNRMTVTAADKKAKTKAWQNYTAGHPGYKAAPHLGEEIDDTMIEEVVEELIQECVEFGYEFDEAANAVEEAATEYLMELNPYAPAGSKEARAYQKSTTSTKRGEARKAAVKGAVERVKAKAKGAAAAAGIAGSIAKDEARRAGRAAAHAVGSAVQKKKAEVKSGVKGLLKRGLSAVAGSAGKVASKAAGAAAKLGEEYVDEKVIVTRGTSTNAAGQKIDWTHSHNTATGRSSVKDKFGERDATDRNPKRDRASDKIDSDMMSRKKGAKYEQIEYVDEAITSEKGKAKAAEMITKRSTPSGRAKPGQGASVAAIKHISRANVENLGGTPPTPTIAKNPVKSRSYGGTGNKAARRAGLTPTREKPNAWKEELDIFDTVLEFLVAEDFAETNQEALELMAYLDEELIEEIIDEARRADVLGHARGTAANPNRKDVPHGDPSQRTNLHSKLRRRADEMGRARRNSPRYKQGGRPALSTKEKSFLRASDRTSAGAGHVRNPNVPDTGRHKDVYRYARKDQKNPRLNPKHDANKG